MVRCLACAAEPVTDPRRRGLGPRGAFRLLDEARSPKQLKQVHAYILRTGLAPCHPALVAKLLRLYAAHGRPELSALVFSAHLPDPPPTLAWNLMIRAHAASGDPRDALRLVARMLARDVPPDKFTFPFVVRACSALADAHAGKAVHGLAVKAGLFDDLFLHHALICFYFGCGDTIYGRKVFDGMRVRNVVSWTALISGLIACGEMETAWEAFGMAPVRNVVTWTAMIDACAKNGRPDEAFELFQRMQVEGLQPNEFTYVALLVACTELGSLNMGRWIHEFAHKNGGLERNVFVGTTLIDMYSKCGSLADAVGVFSQMPVRSLATWNSMITSLGVHGHGREALTLFKEMEKENVRPDRITFVGVLCACVRADLVDEGCKLFSSMIRHYGINPGSEHYSCMVELLGHVSASHEASNVIENLAKDLDAKLLQSLLGHCRRHGNVRLEEAVRNRIRELEVSKDGISSAQQEHSYIHYEAG